MLYSWDRLNKIGPIKNNRLSVQIAIIRRFSIFAEFQFNSMVNFAVCQSCKCQ